MNILALETSTEHLVLGYVGVAQKEQTIFLGRAHAEQVTMHLTNFMQNLPRPDIVALGSGPGSYTGVRVAASLGLGLARAWGAQVRYVSTFAGIAAQAEGLVGVCVNAHRGNVYGAILEGNVWRLEVQKLPREQFVALLPPNTTLLEDLPPSGLALARLALSKDPEPTLLYL